MKTPTIIFCILTIATISSCGQVERGSGIPVKDTIPVSLIALDQVGASGSVEATGVFTTDDETLLGFKNGGVISRIYVREGEPIRKGQRLASVQSGDLDATSGQVKVALEKAERDYERARRLYRDSVATLEQLQNAQSALELAKEDLNAINYNQQHLHIYAPVGGFVLARLANEGQVVGPGTPVLQVNGAGKGQWMLKVGVSDAQWSAIAPGDEAEIVTDALPGQQLRAKVSRKSEALDPQSGTFTIYLDLLDDLQGKIASGIFAKASIQTKGNRVQSQWKVPYESLLDAQGKEAYLFVTYDGKTAMKQRVVLGQVHKDWVTVVEGLDSVQSLIVSGSPYLVDGSPIVVKK